MAKPRPHQNREPTDLIATIRERLAAGRSKSALEAAKELHKSSPSSVSEGLLADAYAARVAELSGNGSHKEAEEVLSVARARFPAEAERWIATAKGAALQRGDLTEVLRNWVAGGSAREAAGAEIRRHLNDPLTILRIDPTVLPAADPLRDECSAILQAFEQAAKGMLDDEAREALRQIGRRSPLMPWRAFVLALDAFHARDDVRCREQLARIADDDAVARGRDTLRIALLDATPHDDAVALRTARRLVGDAVDAVEPAREMRALRANGPGWAAALVATLRALRPLGGRPVLRLLRWLASTTHPDELIDIAESAGVGRNWFGMEWWRVLALMSDHPIESTIDRCCWIRDAVLRLIDRDPRIPAVAIDSILERRHELESAVDSALGEGTWRRWRSGVDSHRVLAARHESRADTHQQMMIFALFMLEQVAHSLAVKVPETLETNDPITQLAECAVTLDGTPKRFAVLANVTVDESPKIREAALRRWIERFPEDPNAWLNLSAVQLESDDLSGAQASLNRVSAIAPLDQSVQRMRFSAALIALARAWRADDLEEIRTQLRDVEDLPRARQPLESAFLRSVRHMVEDRRGDTTSGDWEARAARAAVRWAFEGHRPVAYGKDRRERLAFLARVTRLAEAAGRALSKLPSGLDPATEFEVDDLPKDPDDLLAICCMGKSAARGRRLAQLSAWHGACLDGPKLPYFLAALATFTTTGAKRHHQCLALARHFGMRSESAETRSAVEQFDLPSYVEDLTPSEAALLLADIRANLAPKARMATKPRRSRPRQLELPFGDEEENAIS
jgi:hypothetical protein